MNNNNYLKILHIVGGMNRGGVETWLMNVLRKIDRKQYKMDFLVHTTQPCAYDDEVRSLGSKIIPCLYPHKPWLYARNFKQALLENGPYDIVHSHVHHFSGFILRLASKLGIPKRIAHSHNDTVMAESKKGFIRQIYLYLMKIGINQYSTLGLACSQKAAAALYGSKWQGDARWQVLYYGIDLEPFHCNYEKDTVRSELGIPTNALVVGHVGRFVEQKNHTFLIDIFAALTKKEPNSFLLLVGDGPMRSSIEKKVDNLCIRDKVIFAGIRGDIPRLMKGAMDMFVFPSIYEGLPVVLIEAQAAGLPCIISNVVTEEVDAINYAINRLNINDLPNIWADTITSILKRPLKLKSLYLNNLYFKSSFDINESINNLINIYIYK